MNKKKLLLLPAFLFLLSACGNGGNKDSKPNIIDDDTPVNPGPVDQKTLVSISVKKQPTKLVYEIGEEFDAAGLEIEAVYSDESTDLVEGYSLSTPDMSTAGTKTITVTYQGKTVTFTITVNNPNVATVIGYGEQTTAVSHPGTWYFWNDQEWCGSKVVVPDNGVTLLNGVLEANYTVESGACDWGFQLFYKDPALQSGVKYKQTFSIKSLVATEIITINGTYELEANVEKQMEIHYWQTDDISFKASIKAVAGQTNTLTIKNLAVEQSLVLDAPLNVAVDEEYKITFVEAQHATSYEVKLTDENDQVIEGFEHKAVTKGAEIEGLKNLPEGTYKLYIRSLGDGFVTSEWTKTPVLVVVGSVTVDPFSKYSGATKTFAFGTKDDAVANPGTLYYWNDQNWCGSSVSVSKAEFVEGELNAIYTVASGACDWGFQIFFKNPYLSSGKKYEISFTFETLAAGKIGLNGSENASIDVVAGANQMKREYTETADAASLALVIPASLVSEGSNTIKLSNITWTEK